MQNALYYSEELTDSDIIFFSQMNNRHYFQVIKLC